jgi:outer membrane lipopolysaccharide assembly protein LptE/RlpB
MLLFERSMVLIRVAVLVLAALLVACGFRLQGSDIYPDSMANTFIDTDDRYTPFYRDLSITLEQGGVNLTGSPIDADTVIRLERDETGQRVLTVSSRNVPTEYDVYYRVQYSVMIAGEEVVSSRGLSRNQDYTYDPAVLLGKNREADEIRDAISRDLVRQVSYELSRLR